MELVCGAWCTVFSIAKVGTLLRLKKKPWIVVGLWVHGVRKCVHGEWTTCV